MNVYISDNNSLFSNNLKTFCSDNNLILSSELLLPPGRYTYISEAWYTISWLDHCISTEDAHSCITSMEVHYDLSMSDHIPVSMTLGVDMLPALTNECNDVTINQVEWAT